MNRYYQSKIEKSRRHGKALFVTCFIFFFVLWADEAFASTGACSNRSWREQQLCGGDLRERGPRAAAMGGCAAAVANAAETAFFNPANIFGNETSGVIFWTPARFGMTELGSAAGAWVQALPGWSAAIALQRYGFDLYSEHRIGLSAALPLSGSIAAGMRISALNITIARYGSTVIPLVDIGLRCSITEELDAGVVGSAVNMPTIDGDERLPTGLSAGLAWRHAGCMLALDCEKTTRYTANIRLGAECMLLPQFGLRCGASTLTRQWTAGFVTAYAGFRVEYAMSMHSELGATHTVGIGFEP